MPKKIRFKPVVLKLGTAVPLESAKQFQGHRKEVADLRKIIPLNCASLNICRLDDLFFAFHLVLRGDFTVRDKKKSSGTAAKSKF